MLPMYVSRRVRLCLIHIVFRIARRVPYINVLNKYLWNEKLIWFPLMTGSFHFKTLKCKRFITRATKAATKVH